MRNRSALLFCSLFLIPFSVSAQYYETGQDPANLKWLQIKTDRFRVIYPENYGNHGIEFARTLEKAADDLSYLFPGKKIKIPVIIHSYTTQSNGYVAWAPKRMEIYPTPEQNTIPLHPFKQLALHELTHVMQMQSLNSGFAKAMSLFFGQQFPGAVTALLPLWYLEGDAVYAESVFTESGRGRSPAFQKQLKAISVEKGSMYKYDKLVNGSFRNFVPDHYETGAQAVALTHLKYSKGTWNKVLRTTANAPFLIDPVNISLLRNTGHTKKGIFKETFDTLSTIWNDEIKRNGSVPYTALNREKKNKYLSYHSPVPAGDNTIIAVKTSLSDPPCFVQINTLDKSEKKIHVPGYIYPYYISFANSMLVWVENQTDPRWENRNYSVIKIMDIRDGIVRQIAWKTRYLSASVSPDGKTISAVANSVENKNSLILFDMGTEKITGTFSSPDNASLQRPQWSADGSEITVISLTEKGEGIMSFKPADGSWKVLLNENTDDYQSSFLRNDSLYFVSSASGTENIFVLSPDNKAARITNSRFGATDLIVSRGTLMFSDYTASGNDICAMQLKNATVHESAEPKQSSLLIDNVTIPENIDKIETEQIFYPRRYRKWQHLFGFHSWMPFYADIEEIKDDPTSITPGFTLMSQNQLSTLITTLGYEYTNKRHMFHSQVTWQGLYPVLESRIDYGDQNSIYRTRAGLNLDDQAPVKPELVFSNTLSVPLTFTTGKFSQYIRPSLSANYRNAYILYVNDDTITDYGQTELSARFFFSNYHRSSMRDIYPRFKQVVDFNYSFYPFDKDIYGSFITLRTAAYFPGFFKNHGIRLRYEIDKQNLEQLLRWNRINHPRSYKNIASERINSFSVDYTAPLFYPDFNLLSLLYLTRIRADVFYDYASGTGNYYPRYNDAGSLVGYDHHDKTESFTSYGVELLADFHVLRLPYMVSAGVQAAWQKGVRSPFFEAIFNIDIYGMIIGSSHHRSK